MADIKLFEKFVRIQVESLAINRAPTEDELKDAVTLIRGMMKEITDEEAGFVIRKLQSALDVAMDVGVVLEKDYEPWFMAKKDSIVFFYWERYALYLEQDQQRTSGVIAAINEVSDRIIDLAGDPTVPSCFPRKGLLLGDIQSGKTSNYIAVLNKAADVGFKVIILLTSNVENLRRQTQERVDEGFIGRSSKAYLQGNRQTIKRGVGKKDSQRFATGFTTDASDFKSAFVQGVNFSLHSMSNEPVVFVMKKNAKTLQNLIDWLEKYNTNNQGVIELPLLLIDDEADNASINTKTDNDPTTINKHIRKLLSLFNESSYIAVTATPFANIFILPEKNEEMENDELFPADYIYALDPPTNYIGGNEVFGEDAEYADSLVRIDDAEKYFPYKHNQYIVLKGLPDSLYSALRYFLLANVVRDISGEVTSHRSMLVNVSRFVRVQERINQLIVEWLYEVQRDIRNFCMLSEDEACHNKFMRELRDDWNNSKYPFSLETAISWEEVQHKYLLGAVSSVEVRTINQRSSGKLDYAEYGDTGLRVIAVGGLSLSRGLTLEGLVVSYFHRNTQMYDTLMQMGRWFGYRDGYEKLFRIWMPDDAIGWYAHITQASNELREEIAKMNRLGAAPKDFGLKVRAHPTSLIVTARNKMKHAERQECWITLDGKFFETPRFKSDISVIRANKQCTDKLITNILSQCGQPIGSGSQPYFWSDVPREIVSSYIRTYESHPLNMEADSGALVNYIKDNPNFKSWDVLVVNGSDREVESTKLGIHSVRRPISKKSGVLSAYGTKMRVGAMGLTRHGLSEKEREDAEQAFRELKRSEYELKYGASAEEKLQKMNIPDRAYLIQGRSPILIIHYLTPDFGDDKHNTPIGYDVQSDFIVAYGIGFPNLAGSDPVYAVYYINMVEQRQNFESEIEEDQLDDNDD